MRTAAWRRAQNTRVIRKRQNIIKDCWLDKKLARSIPGGKMRKWNFTCNCRMCKMDRHYGSLERRKRQLAKAVQQSDYC